MWLRLFISGLLLLGLHIACAPIKKTSRPATTQKIELAPNEQDSTEYELIIIDPGFQSWFDAHYKPKWYYSNDYLANWNHQYVVYWNQKVRDPLSHSAPNNPFIMEIDYRHGIDYGLDLNYKLYHYFKYIESTWGNILPFDRHN